MFSENYDFVFVSKKTKNSAPFLSLNRKFQLGCFFTNTENDIQVDSQILCANVHSIDII